MMIDQTFVRWSKEVGCWKVDDRMIPDKKFQELSTQPVPARLVKYVLKYFP